MKNGEQHIKRTGQVSEKERLGSIIVELSKKVRSLPHLQKCIEQQGIKTYMRNGILTGIWNDQRTRKYRLRTLGIDTQKLERMISKEKERLAELKRNRKQNKNRER